MTKEQKLISVAIKEVGYSETPANSNRTKYGAWFGLDGLPWCGIFISWVYWTAGYPLGNIGYLKGFAGCQTAVAYFRKHGAIVTDPMPGDLAFFDWNNDGRHDHVGMFSKNLSADEFESIEGNTSLTNQSNGGSVMARYRKTSTTLFARPSLVPKPTQTP